MHSRFSEERRNTFFEFDERYPPRYACPFRTLLFSVLGDLISKHLDLRKISAVCSILELSPKHLRVYEWLSEKLVLTGDSWALHTQGWKLLASSAKDDQLGVFPKIKALAQQGHSWWAMTLYGHYLKQKGQLENAASWHRKAMDLAKPCTREEVPLPMTRSGIQPWAAYATIKMQLGDIDEAEKAALVGALEYHKPQGYMMLTSVLYAKKECDKLEEYLTRAAMSHNSAACYQLGEIYRLWHHGPERVENDGYHGKFLPKEMLPRVMSLSSRYHSPDEYYNIAKEWLELASIQEHPLASLQLAVLLREENKHEEGISCLDRAAKTPKYADVVAELRELWHESDADINSIMRKCVEL